MLPYQEEKQHWTHSAYFQTKEGGTAEENKEAFASLIIPVSLRNYETSSFTSSLQFQNNKNCLRKENETPVVSNDDICLGFQV